MRQQVGALPIRWIGDELRVLLVTSRETQRWIIPKGWRMRGRSNAEAAAQEAFEEAGVRGRVGPKPIGRYVYAKRRPGGVEDCKITTYLLEVSEELEVFPEMAERGRAWFTLSEAEACADDEGLRDILRGLGPRLQMLRKRSVKAAMRLAKATSEQADSKQAASRQAASEQADGQEPASKRAASEVASGGKAATRPRAVRRASRRKAGAETAVSDDEAGAAEADTFCRATRNAIAGRREPGGVAAVDVDRMVEPSPGVAAAGGSDASDARTRKRNAGKAARVAARRLRKAMRKAVAKDGRTHGAPLAAE